MALTLLVGVASFCVSDLPPASALHNSPRRRQIALIHWATDRRESPRLIMGDLNADNVLSDHEELGYGRIDTAPRGK